MVLRTSNLARECLAVKVRHEAIFIERRVDIE